MLSNYNTPSQTSNQNSTYDQPTFANLQISHPYTLKATFDCGVQANLDLECANNPQTVGNELDDSMVKKRQKRKQYKKRKKMQKKIMQRQNKQQFQQIIDLFYEREAKFVDYADRLEELVCSFNQNEFKNIFDSILKQRVVIIQNSIWQYTQAILEENPLEMRHDHPFYLEMVDQIYKYYKLIQRSSQQAEQVIYIYLTLNAKDTDQPITPQDLGRRTFRYLIQTDETLRKLIHMCDKKISYVRLQQRQKLQILISKLKNFRERFQNTIFQEDEESQQGYYENVQEQQQQSIPQGYQQDEQSTAISEQCDEFYQNGQHCFSRKKKSKRMIRDTVELQEQEEKLYYFLENLNINPDNRLACNLDQQQVYEKTHSYIMSIQQGFNKKHNEFDILRNQLENDLKPRYKVSQEFKRLY